MTTPAIISLIGTGFAIFVALVTLAFRVGRQTQAIESLSGEHQRTRDNVHKMDDRLHAVRETVAVHEHRLTALETSIKEA